MSDTAAWAPEWVFDPMPPSKAVSGGDPASYVFNPKLDTLVREVVQNSTDQQITSEPVEITFTVKELSDRERRTLLSLLDWEGLSKHYYGVAHSTSLINGRVADALARVNGGRLTVMTIEDSGARGLTGPEDGLEGNFTALCKHVLVTSDKKTAGGGSYGLGKAVLWRFSSFSTVLFGSRFIEDGREDERVFGRAELPHHFTGELEHSGSGWFGNIEKTPAGPRAVSVRGISGLGLAEGLQLGRARPNSTGTTILILGFSEPGQDEGRPSSEVAKSVLEAVTRWFWPRLLDGTLKVTSRSVVDGITTFSDQASVDESDPFALLTNSLTIQESAPDEGDVAEREIPIRIPALKSAPSADVEGFATVRLIRTPEDGGPGDARANTVALVRGAGMVVQYRRPRQLPLFSGGFVAVLAAGTRRGDTNSDLAIEEFFRACEPPSHDEWTHTTNKLSSRYRTGARTRLLEFFQKLDTTIVQMCEVPPPQGEPGPPLLAKFFTVGGTSGSKGTRHKFEVRFGAAHFDGSQWRVSGSVQRTKGDAPWAVEVDAALEGIGGFKSPTDIRLGTELTQGVQAVFLKEGKLIHLLVPSDIDFVKYDLTAIPSGIDASLAPESRFRVDARPHERTAQS